MSTGRIGTSNIVCAAHRAQMSLASSFPDEANSFVSASNQGFRRAMNNIVIFPGSSRRRSPLAIERTGELTSDDGRAFGIAARHGWLTHDLNVLARELEHLLEQDAESAAERIGLPEAFLCGFAFGRGLGSDVGSPWTAPDLRHCAHSGTALADDPFSWDLETLSEPELEGA